MEVHHHAHTERKKWTQYIWEFLMLFLAVSLGFFVENQREHYVEHQREEQYMQSMIEDLVSDTTQFASNRRIRVRRLEMIDSMIELLSLPDYKNYTNAIYYFGRVISPPVNIYPNDRTIQQLKSAGGLRLIRKLIVSNNIMAYDQQMRLVLSQLVDEVELRAEYRQLARSIFDGKVWYSMFAPRTFNRPVNNPPLFKSDPESINTLISELQYFKKADSQQVERITELLDLATALLALIKKEYGLK
jgi:hypothetical protein